MSTVTETFPRDAALEERAPRRTRIVLLSALAGIAVAVAWSYTFVDSVIGDNVANSLLGYDAKEAPITGSVTGAVFAFVSGLAGTFTACNIAAFSAVAPLMNQKKSKRTALLEALKPVAWLAVGMFAVAATYGAIGALIGTRIPQLSTEVVGNGFPVRLIQSSVVFGVVGLALLYMGLAALKLVPDPLARVSARHPRAQLVVMGGLIGAFLIGRPFPLFFKMFEYAASTHNAFIGAGTFVLQAAGNIVVMVVLFLLLAHGTRGGFQRWLESRPGRIQVFTASALVVAGVFTFVYWVVRLPAAFGYGWWPTMPWN